jgi:hypothetical protein
MFDHVELETESRVPVYDTLQRELVEERSRGTCLLRPDYDGGYEPHLLRTTRLGRTLGSIFC